MLLDVTQEDRTLWVSYFNLNGEPRFKTYQLLPEDMFNWEVCEDKDPKADSKMKNWDGRSVKKVGTRYLNKYRIIEYMEGISFSDKELIFGYHFPKTYFIDIEVEVIDGFPEPSKAESPITTICIVTPSKECIVLATKDLDRNTILKIGNQINEHFASLNEKFTFHFKHFNSEYDMLYTFLHGFVRKFSMMTGWNYVKFDWQYIVNRARKLNIDPSIASPIDKLSGKEEFPAHVGVMDYLDIYAKWDRTIDIKEDFKLDTVGEAVVGVKKIKYDGTIQDLYEKEYPKYVFYNAVDTALVYLIHQKIKTMDIALTIAHMSKISIFKAASPVSITESLLAREFLGRDQVMANDPKASGKKSTQYEGAFVKEPIVGMHAAVAAFDFASLYPSIMRQMNVSPESLIKKVKPELRKAEEAPDRIVSVTGAVYETEESILKTILTRLYSQRREYKKKSFELQQRAYDMEQELKHKA